jgi:LacI family transcriptional regulator
MKQIVLIYPYTTHWWAEFYLGVAAYAKQQEDWTILISPPTVPGSGNDPLTLNDLRDWPGDGVLTHLTCAAEVAAAKKLKIPIVNISSALEKPGFPTITLDQAEVGRLAAQHLLKCGFRRLAYYGMHQFWYARQQLRGFEEITEPAGVPVEVFESSGPKSDTTPWLKHRAQLAAWLKTLKTPIGLLVDGAYRARAAVDECQRLGIAVPHDIAVISGDNQPVICEYSLPTLTSVTRDGYRHGFEAARLLDRLMRGETAGESPFLVPPICVIMRRSTDTITVENPHVTTVVRYMYDHLGEPFGIKQLLRLVPISRRMLEKYFQLYLRCTPHDYLCWIRVEKAKQLLQEPGPVALRNVARNCGFRNSLQLRTVFKRLTGQSPTQYMNQHAKNVKEYLKSTPEEGPAAVKKPSLRGAKSRAIEPEDSASGKKAARPRKRNPR